MTKTSATPSGQVLAGLCFASFESRRSTDMARLIEKRGGTAIVAPSMQEVPLSDNTQALEFGEELFAGNFDGLILLTGVGTRILIDALATKWSQQEVIAELKKITIISRGPKPVAALKAYLLKPDLVAPEPNTWENVLEELDAHWPVQQKSLAIQEYGARNQRLLNALEKRGATVSPVPVYGWQLPSDVDPLKRAIQSIIKREVDSMVFTSGHQIRNLMTVAAQLGLAESLTQVVQEYVVVASVGPVTNEALEEANFPIDIVPTRPKMGHLVNAIAEQAPAKVKLKRSQNK